MRPAPRSVTPGEGALRPSTVMYELLMVMSPARTMVPATSNTTVRLPAATAARRLPGPASFRFVTWTIVPYAPPGVDAPNPSAPAAGRTPASMIAIATATIEARPGILTTVSSRFSWSAEPALAGDGSPPVPGIGHHGREHDRPRGMSRDRRRAATGVTIRPAAGR
jgi:hypothetical protein